MRYDPNAGSWEAAASLPAPMEPTFAGEVGGRFIAFGNARSYEYKDEKCIPKEAPLVPFGPRGPAASAVLLG